LRYLNKATVVCSKLLTERDIFGPTAKLTNYVKGPMLN
jgi:hypothetical protein